MDHLCVTFRLQQPLKGIFVESYADNLNVNGLNMWDSFKVSKNLKGLYLLGHLQI